MDKFSELKAAAMAATPGPWGINRTGNTIVSNHSHPVATVSDAFHRQLAGGGVGKDAEFITAANPAAVLALLAELEDERASREQWQQNCTRTEERIAERESEMKVWESAATKHLARAEEAEQRIAELEAIRSDASQVFKEIGNELGCNPDNESIMMAIDALKERLDTPVRLPGKTSDLDSWDGGWDACLEECAEAIRAAGFKVEGDE